MDYLKAAREAYECAQEAEPSALAEEHRRYADTCALIAIAEQLCRLNASLRGVHLVIDDRLGEMGIGTPV